MPEPTLLVSALVLGFAGSLHCVAMCGGIAGALAQSASLRGDAGARAAGLALPILNSLGRVTSYAAAGGVAGALGGLVPVHPGGGLVMRVLLGLVLVAIGIELARTGRAFGGIERMGYTLWRRVLPVIGRLGRPDRPLAAFALGALWGWLPCGLVYSALLLAAASGGMGDGASTMAAFGLGTLPAVVTTARFAAGLARLGSPLRVRRTAGALLVVFGLWSIVGPWVAPSGHAGHCEHAPDSTRTSL